MIQITAYLRTEEDLAKWKAIGNKSEFIHNALNPLEGNYELKVDLDKSQPLDERGKMYKEVAEEVFSKPIKSPITKKSNDLCPHGMPWMLCKDNGCNIKGRNLGL